MHAETSRSDGSFGILVVAFPLTSIDDELSYSRAIEILDRLFLLDREQNREERDYFRSLAEFAYEYESRTRRTARSLLRVH